MNYPKISSQFKKPQVLILRDLPPPYGGVRVSSTLITKLLLSRNEIFYRVVEFDNRRGPFLRVLWNYFIELRNSKAVLFQIGDIFTLSRKKVLVFLVVAILMRRPIIYRGFGGITNVMKNMSKSSLRHWRLFRNYLALATFETRQDVSYLRSDAENSKVRIGWFPNTPSSKPMKSLEKRHQASKFCFFGKICKAKGVDLLFEVSKDLPNSVSIDIYGEYNHADCDIDIGKLLNNQYRIFYRGTVEPERLVDIMKEYDGLLLPTSWRTEGYPGVVLEALSVGMPIITTNWNALPEIIDSTCGILINVNSSEELKRAILTMHNECERWKRMRKGALARAKEFDPQVWANKMHDWIAKIVMEGQV
jgi:glycosyltransferase involved in cell wall biosynthesis